MIYFRSDLALDPAHKAHEDGPWGRTLEPVPGPRLLMEHPDVDVEIVIPDGETCVVLVSNTDQIEALKTAGWITVSQRDVDTLLGK